MWPVTQSCGANHHAHGRARVPVCLFVFVWMCMYFVRVYLCGYVRGCVSASTILC